MNTEQKGVSFEAPSPMRLAWGALTTDSGHGYGYISHRYPSALAEAGVDVVNPYDPDWDLSAFISTPVGWFPDFQERLVLHTMYEAWPLPKWWVQNMNRAGLIWTPSTWCRDLFLESGVTRPIMVSPYGVDADVYQPVSRRGRDGIFRVALWGDTLFSRKNVWQAIKVFIDADIPDSVLEVKLSALFSRDVIGNVSVAIGPDGKPFPKNVKIVTGTWPESSIVTWLQRADVGIYLSGGEGFGLMPLNQMSTGLPIVCTYNTGMMEYLTYESAMLVPCFRGLASPGSYEQRSEHEVPDYAVAVDMLRWAAANREAACEIGERAADRAKQFSWTRAGALAATGLEEYARHRALIG
jgi:glycosyltransferase involved in cell wall biosynthesis